MQKTINRRWKIRTFEETRERSRLLFRILGEMRTHADSGKKPEAGAGRAGGELLRQESSNGATQHGGHSERNETAPQICRLGH